MTLFRAQPNPVEFGRGFPTELADEGVAGIKATRISDQPPRRFRHKKWVRFNINLGTTRVDLEFRIAGTLIWAADSTLTTDLLEVRLDSRDNDRIPFRTGTHVGGSPFERIYLTNVPIGGSTMVLMVATDFPDDRIDIES